MRHSMIGPLAGLSAAVLLGGCDEAAGASVSRCTPVAGDHAAFAEGDCPPSVPSDGRLSCGTLELAEDPDKARSCRITLAWVRYDPARPSDEPPVFVLGGGPGAVLVERTDEVVALAERVAPDRSWVVHDPRGVGESSPRLDCAESGARAGDLLSGLEACARAYRAAGHDPARYRTETLAADVDALAAAFGAEQVDLFGASYGSRLGYAYASLYPGRVRALVLDSATPLDAPLLERPVGSYLQAMSRITNDCAASASCTRWHGDVAAAHAANVARLADDAPRIDHGGQSVPLSAQLYVALTAQLAASPHVRLVPAFVRAIADAELAAAEGALSALEGSPIATYVHHAVMCSEELPQNDRARALDDLARLPAYGASSSYDRVRVQCEALGLAPAPGARPAWHGRVARLDGSQPVLALTGRYDPLSVASNWLDAQLSLPSGSLFVMPDASHAARNSVCGTALVSQFLAEPHNGLELPEACAPDPDFFAERFELGEAP